jgi:hypothetical protein
LSRHQCTSALGVVQSYLALASAPLGLVTSLLKVAMVLGVLAVIGIATGVINVKFKPLG